MSSRAGVQVSERIKREQGFAPRLDRIHAFLSMVTLLVLPHLQSLFICSHLKEDFKRVLPGKMYKDHLYFTIIWHIIDKKKKQINKQTQPLFSNSFLTRYITTKERRKKSILNPYAIQILRAEHCHLEVLPIQSPKKSNTLFWQAPFD